MFIVRKGTLRVYLEKDGSEVELAKVTAGGMIGEMALFDQLPRSASVRAFEACEVTHISSDDFAKLMKQIPKWFTALMGTLSGRLRATNERLEKLQANSTPAMQGIKSIMRMLLVIDLLLYRDGEKVGKEWLLEKEPVLNILTLNFADEKEILEKLFAALEEENLIKIKKNQYKKLCISTQNRGNLTRFVDFLGSYLKNSAHPCLTPAALDMLKAMKIVSERQAYESFTVSLEDLIEEGQKQKMSTIREWDKNVGLLRNLHSDLNVTKTGSDALAFKSQKKQIKEILANHSVLATLNSRLIGK